MKIEEGKLPWYIKLQSIRYNITLPDCSGLCRILVCTLLYSACTKHLDFSLYGIVCFQHSVDSY